MRRISAPQLADVSGDIDGADLLSVHDLLHPVTFNDDGLILTLELERGVDFPVLSERRDGCDGPLRDAEGLGELDEHGTFRYWLLVEGDG